MNMHMEEHRCGYVALAGRPNTGKSTLLNAIIGQKLSIVSPVKQTTRNRILAVHNIPGTQMVILDTPGIQSGKKALNRYMYSTAMDAMGEADVTVLIMLSPGDRASDKKQFIDPRDEKILDKLLRNHGSLIVAVNKIDLLDSPSSLLPVMAYLAEIPGVDAVVPVSALHKDGIDELVNEIVSRLPESPPFFPPDMLTDRPEKFFVCELVREAIIEQTKQEIPHASAVTVESFEAKEDGSCVIRAVVHVETESQKGIIVGKGGSRIKSISMSAREKAREFLDTGVHLFLRVVTTPMWSRDKKTLNRLGYE